jgi:hypothetical protein
VSVRGGEEGTYNASISLRTDPRILRPKSIDDSAETEINTPSHERRRDCQTHNLHQEPCLAPLVLPALNTSNIANNFEGYPSDESEREGCCATCDCVCGEEAEERNAEEREEGGVCRQGDAVVVVGGGDVAGTESAVFEFVGACLVCVCALQELHSAGQHRMIHIGSRQLSLG